MKMLSYLTAMLLILFAGTVHAASFVSGSTGADGAFNPTTNTELQLPPDGIFNFTTVNIPSGVKITFKKNASNTSAYILATGDVIISGTIDVSGGSSPTDNHPGVSGPGGFDGGFGGIPGISNGAGGKGLGPGGGGGGPNLLYVGGAGGGFGTAGGNSSGGYAQGGSTYGNSRLIPLIGGSGGGGASGGYGIGTGGGGGGGAILIASSGNVKINGTIYAVGGGGKYVSSYTALSGSGSGGAIKLIANSISGMGSLNAVGLGSYSSGGSGRIRIEAYTNTYGNISTPNYTSGLPGSVFLANIPSLSITSIAGVNISSNPTGSYSTPDIELPTTTTNPVTVALSASNIPLTATITISTIPKYGNTTNVTAILTGTDTSSTATASVNLSTDYASVIMAYTTYTLQTAMFYEGEKIDKVRIASSMGVKSEAVYITESGKEIKANQLILAGLLN